MDEKGYQYCNKCGKAVLIGLPEPKPCQHVFEQVSAFTISNIIRGNTTDHVYIMRCKHCGAMKEERFGVSKRRDQYE